MSDVRAADIFSVLYARCYMPPPDDMPRFAALAESGHIAPTSTPHGQFAGYELRRPGWEIVVSYMGYER